MNASQLQREAASRAMKMARAAGMEKSMAQAMGCQIQKLGDSTGALKGFLA